MTRFTRFAVWVTANDLRYMSYYSVVFGGVYYVMLKLLWAE